MTKKSTVVPVWVAGLICDSATIDPHTGKKNLIGIFDRLWVIEFPTKRHMSVYLKIADAEGRYNISAKFVYAKTNAILLDVQLDVEIKNRLNSQDYLIQIPFPIQIPEEGRYEFRFFANEVYLGSATLDAGPRE